MPFQKSGPAILRRFPFAFPALVHRQLTVSTSDLIIMAGEKKTDFKELVWDAHLSIYQQTITLNELIWKNPLISK